MIKSIKIEEKIWNELNKFQNKIPSNTKLIRELLVTNEGILTEIEDPKETNPKEARRINLTEKSLEIYNNLPVGRRYIIVNELLRDWLKNQINTSKNI